MSDIDIINKILLNGDEKLKFPGNKIPVSTTSALNVKDKKAKTCRDSPRPFAKEGFSWESGGATLLDAQKDKYCADMSLEHVNSVKDVHALVVVAGELAMLLTCAL